jgi:lysophospholipase L1-like esterase
VDVFRPARSARDRVALLRRFAPWLPGEFRDAPTWSIALDADGFRARELDAAPAARVRIACLGDSWTFGMNVDQDRTFPARLAARLLELRQDTTFDVLNLGVLGYSSFQGLQLMTRRVLALRPDIVTIGFGMNDSEVAGYRDKDMIVAPPSFAQRTRDAARSFETFKLLDYLALAVRFRPRPTGDYLKEEASQKGSASIDYDAIEPWTRVSPHDYERNIREMIRLSKEGGARVALLDNELWGGSPYRPILKQVSAELGVPLIDSYQLLVDARTRMAADREAHLGLRPPEPRFSTPETGAGQPRSGRGGPAGGTDGSPARDGRVTVVFRVSSGGYAVPSAISIAGSDPQLGDYAPNTVAMHDDGSGGDQRAGDGVWSYSGSFLPGTRIFYVYTNSGARGQWEGLDVPTIRQVVVPSAVDGSIVYLPIETFGKIDLQADNWHTDGVGYELIGNALADAVK